MVGEDSQKKITADFQCFVCGAIFTSEEDRRQHLEKEMHRATEKKDVDTVKRQTELSEMNRQHTNQYNTPILLLLLWLLNPCLYTYSDIIGGKKRILERKLIISLMTII